VARRRLTTTALLIVTSTVVLLATAAGCSASAPAGGDAGTRPGPGESPALTSARPDAGSPVPDAVPTGNSWQITVLDAVPDPPRLLAVPTDFASPQSVAVAYLRAWCYAPADKPANTNITDTAPWMTAAGWADDAARSVDEPTWTRTRAAGVSTVCGPATASVSPQAPYTPDTAWVGVTAQQARVRGGAVIGQSPVSMVRRILRAPDGRWLVDVRVMAG
jgi:hypothetical protein